jgi:methylated-DNA-[protein]-cysteine S-methyltransferase
MKTIFIGQTGITPLGDLWVAVSENGLIAVEFPITQTEFSILLQKRHTAIVEFSPEKVAEIVIQLQEYAVGARKEFNLQIDWSVLREFQRQVLLATFQIPFGEVRTYQEVGISIGKARSARAVGRAEATNPMPVILPCHRVIGSDGKLHGYGAGDGLHTKTFLLKLEGVSL